MGALIGGIAGGGKGAAIGALAGGGAGTAGTAFTGNKQIVLPAESLADLHSRPFGSHHGRTSRISRSCRRAKICPILQWTKRRTPDREFASCSLARAQWSLLQPGPSRHRNQLLVFRRDGAIVAAARRFMQAIRLRGVRARRSDEVAACIPLERIGRIHVVAEVADRRS